MRVLVLDDEAAIGRLICRVALSAGMQSQSVTDIQAFQNSFRASTPDLIVLDLQIGAFDGIEQLRFLAEQHYKNSVILISGFDSRVLDVAQQLGRQLGLKVVTSFPKPIRVDELSSVFAELAAASQEFTPQRLMKAINDGELLLEYQPIMTRSPNVLHQFEALVRWQHPVHGRIPPDRFISMAEESDEIIDALTDWVVSTTARTAKDLKDLGHTIPFAVNVSGRNLAALDFPDRMQRLLNEAQLPPTSICFEVTESVASANPTHSMDVLSRLRLKGFGLAIDDFGVGYSSLKRLRQLPFSTLKIDRSFVADMLTSKDSLAIVRSIADLARNLELSTVAEGVEDAETARMLELLGIDALQGYFYARPMPMDRFSDWLSTAPLQKAVS